MPALSPEIFVKKPAIFTPIAPVSICFGACVRNTAPHLFKHFKTMRKIGEHVKEWRYIFVENDSNDESDLILDQFHAKNLKGQNPQGIVHHLPSLQKQMPQRTARIAKARNQILETLLHDATFAEVDFLILMDVDKVNSDLAPEDLLAWIQEPNPEWGAIFANQLPYYYDIWALRHKEWSPDDCWQRVNHRPFYMSGKKAREVFVKARQRRIEPTAPLIEVESAFGGLGVYNMRFLRQLAGSPYLGLNSRGEEICEHVAFHAALRALGARLFVDPALINLRSEM